MTGTILLFAIRYALPRNTSAPFCIARDLDLAEILTRDLEQMVWEIEDERAQWSQTLCADDWSRVLTQLRTEIATRPLVSRPEGISATTTHACPECQGSGRDAMHDRPCLRCKGSGKMWLPHVDAAGLSASPEEAG